MTIKELFDDTDYLCDKLHEIKEKLSFEDQYFIAESITSMKGLYERSLDMEKEIKKIKKKYKILP